MNCTTTEIMLRQVLILAFAYYTKYVSLSPTPSALRATSVFHEYSTIRKRKVVAYLDGFHAQMPFSSRKVRMWLAISLV